MADINYNALPEKLTPSVSADKVLILDSEDGDKVKQQSATLFRGPQGDPGTNGTNGTNGADGLDVTWLGAYAGGTTYAINDAVSYNGSSYICKLASTGNLPTNTTYWDLMAQKGSDGAGIGDVVGPASSTDNAIARYDGTTGKIIQNSGATIDDSGNITATNLSGTNTGDNAPNSNSGLVHTTGNEEISGVKTFYHKIIQSYGTGIETQYGGESRPAIKTDWAVPNTGGGDSTRITPAGTSITDNMLYSGSIRNGSYGDFHIAGKLNRLYNTGYESSGFSINSRFENSGILHGAQGHILQAIWGETNGDPDGTTSDGGWGLEFGAHGNPYIKMIGNDVVIGRTDGAVFIPIASKGNGKVLTSDALGNATWQTVTSGAPKQFRITVPGELVADTSNYQGLYFRNTSGASWTITNVYAAVGKAAAGTGAAAAFNLYKSSGTNSDGINTSATNLFTSAVDLGTGYTSSSTPNTTTVEDGRWLSLRVTSSAGATNKASDLQVIITLA